MDISFSVFDFIVLFGITQGLITCVLLLFMKTYTLRNKLLAFSIISFCLLSVKIILHSMNLWNMLYIKYFPLGVDLSLQPLIYFYAVNHIKQHSNTKFLYTLIPFALFMLYSVVVYIAVCTVATIPEKDVVAQALYFNEVKRTEDYLSLLATLIYLFVGFRELKKYKESVKDKSHLGKDENYKWVKTIVYLMFALGLFTFFNFTFGYILPESSFFRWKLYYIYVAIVIYYIGFRGYKLAYGNQTKVSKPRQLDLTKEESCSLLKKIDSEKFYLDQKLNIKTLALLLNINSRDLSTLLQNELDITFKEFINQKRVDEVKTKLKDHSMQNLSILGIAMESGFNSEASFYRI